LRETRARNFRAIRHSHLGYEYEDWPLELAIEAFERRARGKGNLGERHEASFANLCHPVHWAEAYSSGKSTDG
jgi:hypothetical protein